VGNDDEEDGGEYLRKVGIVLFAMVVELMVTTMMLTMIRLMMMLRPLRQGAGLSTEACCLGGSAWRELVSIKLREMRAKSEIMETHRQHEDVGRVFEVSRGEGVGW
jgi:hypothetical protein